MAFLCRKVNSIPWSRLVLAFRWRSYLISRWLCRAWRNHLLKSTYTLRCNEPSRWRLTPGGVRCMEIGGRLLKATTQNDCSSSVLGVAYHGHRSVVTLSLRSAFAVKPRRQRNLALRLPLERFLCRRRYHLGRAQKRLGSEVLAEQW